MQLPIEILVRLRLLLRRNEKFILKPCKSFRRRVYRMIEKKMTTILSKFTVLCQYSYFVFYFFKLKLILFYNRVVYLWTPTYGCAKAGRPARTYIRQLCEDTGCNPEDLPEAMNDWEELRERVRDIRAGGTTWWWWLLLLC